MKQLPFTNHKWLITNSDVGSVVLLSGLEERKIARSDVGRIYCIDTKNGDYIEDAPLEDEFAEEREEYEKN